MATIASDDTYIDGNQASRTSRLTDIQRMPIEQRVTNEKPSTGVAYVLCICILGLFGAHRLYLGQRGSGIVMLILGITFVGWFITGPWAVIDLLLIPGIIQRRVSELRYQTTLEVMAQN